MPSSLDFNGMLAALGGSARPVPQHPLDELTAAADVARRELRAFDPAARADRPRPVVPRVRRPGR